jgi:hypothetical protein
MNLLPFARVTRRMSDDLPQSVNVNLEVDTTAFADGQHDLQVKVIDAAQNASLVLNRTITIVNSASPAGAGRELRRPYFFRSFVRRYERCEACIGGCGTARPKPPAAKLKTGGRGANCLGPVYVPKTNGAQSGRSVPFLLAPVPWSRLRMQ